jgi:hypothetical protein
VAKIDADWNNPAVIPDVYECVGISNFAGKYTIPAEAFMAQRQGTYKWRVRRSAVNMSNPQACKNANRGATTGWMPYRKFTSLGIEPITPMSQDKSFVTTFSARTIADSMKNYPDTLVFSPTKVQYRLELKQGNKTLYSPCKDTPVFNMQDSPSLFANLLQYDGAVTYTFEALYTFVPNGVINCDPLVFYPSKWRGYPRTFTMATKPELLAPAPDMLTTDGRWPQLSWRPFGGVAGVVAPFGYRVQVSRSSDFSKDLLVDECTIATTYRPDNDGWMAERYGKLFWRISYATQAWTDKKQCRVALNSWSDGRSFTSQVGTVLTEPATGSTSSTGMWPTLRWTNGFVTITNTGYRIQVSTNAQFSTTVVDECTTAQLYTPNNNWWSQSRMGTFYWRVNYVRQAWTSQTQCKAQAVDTALWSETRTFVNPVVDKTVQLSTPATGFLSPDGLWPTLQWNARIPSLGQYGYRIQVSTNRNFTGTLTVDECRTTTSYRPTDDNWMRDPARNGTFFWRVNYLAQPWNGAVNTCQAVYIEPTLWSETRTFVNRPPTNPVVLVTADGMRTNDRLWPQLQWGTGTFMSAPSGYRIQVSRNRTFSSFEVDECTNDNVYLPRDAWWAAERTGVYYWRVNYMQRPWVGATTASCKDASKINGQLWSVPRMFENPPANVMPQLTAPAEGSQSPNGLWVQMQWNPGNTTLATKGYRIQVSTDAQFKTTVVDECTRTSSYIPDNNWWSQSRMGTFYWRVNYVRQAWTSQTQCKAQSIDNALWSNPRIFVNPVVDKTVQLTAPAMGFISSDGLWPTLQWNARIPSLGQYGYRIQVSTNQNFAGTLTVDECRTTNTYRPTDDNWMRDPARNGTFYWRVNYLAQPWNSNANTCKAVYIEPTLWSETRTFVNRPLVNPVVLVTADGFQTNNGLWPQLQWNNGVGITAPFGYRIQVSRDQSFLDASQLVVDECTTAKNYKPTSDLWAQFMMGTFYWRVNYMTYSWSTSNPSSCTSKGPVTEWSVVRSFTNPVVDKRPQLSSPADDENTINGYGVSLSWSPGTNIVATRGYRIQVSTDSSFQDTTKLVVNECSLYTGLYLMPDRLPISGTYYWRVNYAAKAWDSRNSKSCINDTVDSTLWSNIRSFSNTRPNPYRCDSGMGRDWDVCGNLIPYSILEARIEGLTWSGKPQYVYVWNKNKPLRVKVAGMFLTFSACNETTSACYSVYEQQIKSLVLPQGTYTFCFQSDYYGQCGINQYYFSIVSLGFYGSDLIRYNGLRVVVK